MIMGFTWIIFLFFHCYGLTTGLECNTANYGEKECKSNWNGRSYQTIVCSIPEDDAVTKKIFFDLYGCIYWGYKYSVTSGSVMVWDGCHLKVSFCLKREITNATTTTKTTTSTIATITTEVAGELTAKPVEIITDVFKTTLRISYDDITLNSFKKFSNGDSKVDSQNENLALYIGIAVGGVVLVMLSSSILCFLRKRQKRAQEKIWNKTGNVENINYFTDTREKVYADGRCINSPVCEIECLPGEARVNFHRQNVVSKSDYVDGTSGCKENNDYNRISFSGKPIILDPTYDHTASVLAETRIYNATENSTSGISDFVDTEYNHKFKSREKSNDHNTCSDITENGIFKDTNYDHLGNVQTINFQSQVAARGQTTSVVNDNLCDNHTSNEDSELDVYANVRFNQTRH